MATEAAGTLAHALGDLLSDPPAKEEVALHESKNGTLRTARTLARAIGAVDYGPRALQVGTVLFGEIQRDGQASGDVALQQRRVRSRPTEEGEEAL